MSYEVYIKNNRRSKIIWIAENPWHRRPGCWLLLGLLPFAAAMYGYLNEPEPETSTARHERFNAAELETGAAAQFPAPTLFAHHVHGPSPDKERPGQTKPPATLSPSGKPAAPAQPAPVAPSESADPLALATPAETAKRITVKIEEGDSLSLLFRRLGLSPQDLRNIITLSKQTATLKNLVPGQTISFLVDSGQLQALEFDLDLTKTLRVTRGQNGFASEITSTELERRIKQMEGVINDSLFLAGQEAGLSDNLIMQLVAIYGWDIDFALDIRRGDSFKVVYEEKYKEREKVADGPILAAEFTNQDKKIRAVRHQRGDGQAGYYTEDGISMRKAFLRTPLKFSRISSHFNLRRKHPILNKIRAHRGVDYAAPTGTPVKATGAGVVHHVGNKGGYGKTVIIRHGGKYSTLYAHLSRYKKGLRRGRSVNQGEIIGYVGKSGLATGPHLHYEFLVHGAHRNPLTVALPTAESIPAPEMDQFKARTSHLFALLEQSQPVVAGRATGIDAARLAQVGSEVVIR